MKITSIKQEMEELKSKAELIAAKRLGHELQDVQSVIEAAAAAE